jgi:hypothetical protein
MPLVSALSEGGYRITDYDISKCQKLQCHYSGAFVKITANPHKVYLGGILSDEV